MSSTKWAKLPPARRAGLAGLTVLLTLTPLAGTAASAETRTQGTVRTQSAAGSYAAEFGRPTKASVAALLNTWADTLLTRDPARVADLYAPKGVLLPTLSAQVRTDHAGMIDYFTGFLAKEPHATVKQSIIEILGDRSAVNSGTYAFSLKNAQGVRETVQARYTFVYERIEGKWLIVSHHSSLMPPGD
ncbi:SgcJ/EcaC family oxidoreductase [Sphaerisporangium perillae]|uniref:SgcJ/EcaC family oxidoreductase n=1 Tax=Sphaerisporangium perillae TaxID=2935860 RepID=UPI00200DF70F|nr:SgcJ/EcaC family oxidoreductase [Sphaerisporangium perillae]